MNKFCFALICFCFLFINLFSKDFSRAYQQNLSENQSTSYLWKSKKVISFGEILLSWNSLMPKNGKYVFYIKVKTKEGWSKNFKFAEWGSQGYFPLVDYSDSIAQLDQGVLTIKNDLLASEFEVLVETEGGISLNGLSCLFACLSNKQDYKLNVTFNKLKSVLLENVWKQLPMVLSDLNVAGSVLDCAFKMYGYWPFNVAEAFRFSNGFFKSYVGRLNDFSDLHEHLVKGFPVIVGINGALKGSGMPTVMDKLIIVVGWDDELKKVLCIDPAFESTCKILISYDFKDFITAWSRSYNFAYVFINWESSL